MATEEHIPPEEGRTDFFISYTNQDHSWAEWIAWQLEAQGYTTILHAWDFHVGKNVVIEMDRASRQAERTIAVLSPDYLSSAFSSPQWAAAFARDPTGEQSMLIPIRVRPCDVEGFLGQIIFVDLVDHTEQEAQDMLLAAAQRQRGKPAEPHAYPSHASRPKPERFPSTPHPLTKRRETTSGSSHHTTALADPDWNRMLCRLCRSYTELLDQSFHGIAWHACKPQGQ